MKHGMPQSIKTIREIAGRTGRAELAKENRRLRAALNDLINMADGWFYGPLQGHKWPYGFEEPAPLLRARAVMVGDMRRSYWIKKSVLASIAVRKRLRRTPMKVRHVVAGLWIFAFGMIGAMIGHDTGWWEAETALNTAVAAFGGHMAGGAMMWARIIFDRFGIR